MAKGDQLLYGIRPVQELLRSGQSIKQIWVVKDKQTDAVNEILDACKKNSIPCLSKSPRFLTKISGTDSHQGVVASFRPLDKELCFEKAGLKPRHHHWLCLYLDRIQDPQNLGAIVRSAEYYAVDQIFYPEHHGAPFNGTAMKASAGAGTHNPPWKVTSVPNLFQKFKDREMQIIGTSPENGLGIHEVDFNRDTVLVIGNEHEGMGQTVARYVDCSVCLKGFGKVDSLNASVSTGVLLYHIRMSS